MPPVTTFVARFIPSRWLSLAITLLIALTAIAYAPALRGPQLFDDRQAIQDNASITHFATALNPPPGTPVTGRPVVNVTLAFNYWLNAVLGVDQSPDPGGASKTISYHVVNIVFHILCGLLLFGIIRGTLRTDRIPARWRDHASVVSLGLTALWLLHPLQTEAVDYLIQRTELVVALCYLGTLYASIRAWDGSPRWYAVSALACLLGMASKEVMVSAPIMVLLYDRAFHYSAWRDVIAPAQRARRWFYGALAATWLLLIALLLTSPRGNTVGFNAAMPWYEYLHSQGWAIAHYLRLVLIPTTLSIDYDFHLVPHWRGLPGLILLGILAIAIVVAWTRANRWGWAAFLGSWFFLILAPSSSVVPILTEIVAERRMYLPLAAVLVVLVVVVEWVVGGVRRMVERGRAGARPYGLPRASLAVGLLAVAAVLLFDGLTLERSGLYRDPEAIWRDAIAKVPNDARAWNNLGVIVANRPTAGPMEAEGFYRKAVELDSSYVQALVNVGMSDFEHGNKQEAEQRFRRALRLDSTSHFALGGLGTLLLDRGDTTDALPLMERFAAGGAGSEFFATLGEVYLARHRGADAAEAFRTALQQAPDRTDLVIFLGGLLLQQGHAAEAEPYLEEAVRRQPASGVNLALLSLAYANLGRSDAAVEAAAHAVVESEGDARAWFFAGRAMLDARRTEIAAGYFTRAVALAPHDADAVAGLGDAQLALGNRHEAMELYERALRIDPADSSARAGLARLQ